MRRALHSQSALVRNAGLTVSLRTLNVGNLESVYRIGIIKWDWHSNEPNCRSAWTPHRPSKEVQANTKPRIFFGVLATRSQKAKSRIQTRAIQGRSPVCDGIRRLSPCPHWGFFGH